MYVRFLNPGATVVSGSAPTLAQFSLELEEEELPNSHLDEYTKMYKSTAHHWFYPFVKRQTLQMTLNPSTTYPITLSSLRGDIVYIDFKIRSSITGYNCRYNTPIASFQFQDSEGRSLGASNFTDGIFNQLMKCSDYFPGELNLYQPVYTNVFSIDDGAPLYLAHNGMKIGSNTFTNYESLQIVTAPQGVSEIVTIGATPAGITSGSFSVTWVTPYGTETTPVLPYNTSLANTISAIQALKTFDGTVAMNGQINGSFNVIFGGNYANKALSANGYNFVFNSIGAATASGAPAGWSNTPNISGVNGMSAGSYIIDIVAYCTGIIQLNQNQTITVRNN